jgi:hypothetical protein
MKIEEPKKIEREREKFVCLSQANYGSFPSEKLVEKMHSHSSDLNVSFYNSKSCRSLVFHLKLSLYLDN